MSKESDSINLIRSLQKPDQVYCVAFSAGKDSVVILDLAKKSGVPFVAQYSNTTIDPPGTMSFIRESYPEVQILQPKKSFYKLVEEKGLPTRVGRFCCEHLKERAGIGMRTIDGTRWDESVARSIYTPEDCDTRRWMKSAVHIRPILNWSENDVWSYIKGNNLPYIKYYDQPWGFKRHGCVGCPNAGSRGQVREFKFFPRYAKALLIAIAKNRITKPNNVFAQKFNDEYEVFHWWLSGLTIKNWLIARSSELFQIDCKKQIEQTIFATSLKEEEGGEMVVKSIQITKI
jgi:phosphoadenosine phosphosulfate reductase